MIIADFAVAKEHANLFLARRQSADQCRTDYFVCIGYDVGFS